MHYTKYTKEELEGLPLNILRNVDISTREEEEHVQRVIDERLMKMPSIGDPLVFPHSVTDAIKTLDQEKELQAQIDAHNESLKKQMLGEEVVLEHSISQMEEKVETLQEQVKTSFCDSCDSKGVRHKKVCPKNKVTA